MTKFESQLYSLLKQYVENEKDFGFNGASSINGAPIKTRNPKTIENFVKWLEQKQ